MSNPQDSSALTRRNVIGCRHEKGVLDAIENSEEPDHGVPFPSISTVKYVVSRQVSLELLDDPDFDLQATDTGVMLAPPIEYRSKEWKRLHNALVDAFGHDHLAEFGPASAISCGWMIHRR